MSHTFGFAPKPTTTPPMPIVPRERVYGRPPPVNYTPPTLTLDEIHEHELQAAYAAGFRKAEEKFGTVSTDGKTMRDICQEVADKHGVTLKQMRGPRRQHRLVHARHEAAWRCFHETECSYPAIGRVLHKDHTTIMNAVICHQARIDAGEV